ncbi:uncharacterized protein ARMOST_17131 [Armillaria ostoyae]|uniref:Uncharacterized protein n=1 Tax=Armillaria ostoyae TaxID=47428 RepID=A0A284RY51_ARMOS|nr:uncharacterized protein ARMOST_17131 [Armillaria ostoyae]
MKSRKSLEYVREKFSAKGLASVRRVSHVKSSASSYWHTLGVIQRRALPKTPRLYRKINFGLQHEYRGTLCIRKRSCFRVPRETSRYIISSLSFSPCRVRLAFSKVLVRCYKFVQNHFPQLGYP